MQLTEKDIEIFLAWQKSPLKWVCDMFKLEPQPILPEYQDKYDKAVASGDFSSFKGQWFGEFQKGKHVTWQQVAILLGVGAAMEKKAQPRVSIRSGHGIGKSATLSWLLLWFLFCYKNSQIPCTAPTSDQLNDILWKEAQIWLSRLPNEIRALYDWSNDYIRMIESPKTWFARARTARKESPEALAGVHADYVLYLVDEASGVPDEIFNTGEGALTGDNYLFVMISNPTRLIGYFYDSHNSDKESWQCYAFNAEESPIVNKKFVQRIIDKHSINSDEYRYRVQGNFPKEDAIDDQNYSPLFLEQDTRLTPDAQFVGPRRMGIDPAGEGDDITAWVIRDNFKAKIVAREKTSNPKSIAQKTIQLFELFDVPPEMTTVDNFGEGANVAQELALAGYRVDARNVGDSVDKREEEYAKANGDKLYINLRAKGYHFLKKWLRSGGELIEDDSWKGEMKTIRTRTELSGRMKIMSKREMRKQGYKSPNNLDALMLTFIETVEIENLNDHDSEEAEYTPLYPGVNI